MKTINIKKKQKRVIKRQLKSNPLYYFFGRYKQVSDKHELADELADMVAWVYKGLPSSVVVNLDELKKASGRILNYHFKQIPNTLLKKMIYELCNLTTDELIRKNVKLQLDDILTFKFLGGDNLNYHLNKIKIQKETNGQRLPSLNEELWNAY